MKLIDLLLRLYPSEFRARYGAQMRAFHDQRLRENAPLPRIVGDHVVSAMGEQMQSLGPDVKYALRGMLRRPAFAAVVIITIALGVGANTAIFSVVNGILLRPLPYRDVERIIYFRHEPPQWLVSEPQYATYRDRIRSFESVAIFNTGEANLETREDPERVGTASVSLNFFSTLGVAPQLGRSFAPGEDIVRPATVVMLSHRLWQERFNGDPDIVGKTVVMNARPRTVVGVMPARFAYPMKSTQVWLPACSLRNCSSFTTSQPDTADGWGSHSWQLVARLRPGYTVEQAHTEANRLARQITREQKFDPPLVPRMLNLRDELVGTTRPYLYALLGAVGVVLLVVCANVASLLLSRGEARRREMSLRAALGASKRRLVMQLLTEAVVLALGGGLAGIGLAVAGSRGIIALAPPSIPRLEDIRVDWIVVLFAIAVATIAGIVFGIVPALRASREDPAEALKSAGKGTSQSGSTRARRLLVVSEVALAMVLLSGAGMLVRSLIHLHGQKLGYTPADALTMKVSVSGTAYDDARTQVFWQQLVERAHAIPGMNSVGAARWLPVVDAGGLWEVRVDGKTYGDRLPTAVPQEVTPGWFAAMGMKVVQGRDFTDQDRAGTQLVGVVSESFANMVWKDEGALGRRYRLAGLDSTRWVTVVGIVSDIRSRGFVDKPEPTMYLPYAQAGQSSYYVPRSMTMVLRARPGVDPQSLASAARAAVSAIDPKTPVSSVATLESVVGTSTANRRFSTALIAGFALLALVLAGIGIYGVVSYAVSERTFEIGVRMALGADRSEVLGLVVGDGVKLALVGISIGVVGSAILARVIKSLLFGAPTIDVVTMGSVGAVLGIVAIAASALPATRATAVNPTEALRSG